MKAAANSQELQRAHEHAVTLEFTIQGRSTTLSGIGRFADGQLCIDVKDDAGDFTLCLDEATWDGEMIESGEGYLIRLAKVV